MNAYEVRIWRSVKHNGVFVCNNDRLVVIHARNKEQAEKKITLAKAINNLNDGLVEVSAEWVYSTELIGTVTIQPFYVYSKGRNNISVADFKKRMLDESKRGN